MNSGITASNYLSGELDIFPDGKAMEVIIEEFARLENEYLKACS
jgi:hypothetical protein